MQVLFNISDMLGTILKLQGYEKKKKPFRRMNGFQKLNK